MKGLKYCLIASLAIIVDTTEASTLKPPVLPLIVRNPYLSSWLGNARKNPWEHWPIFYTGQEVGLGVLVSIPDTKSVFPLLGRPQDSLSKSDERQVDIATQGMDIIKNCARKTQWQDFLTIYSFNISYPNYLGATFDASTTNLTYNIPASELGQEGTQITLSFLSPLTPTSTLRQSIPASYLTVYMSGRSHVDLYIDINGLWVTGNRQSKIVWDLIHTLPKDDSSKSSALKTWRVKREQEKLFSEDFDRSEWGTLHFSAPVDVKYEAGTSALLRQKFSKMSTLQNLVDNKFRPVMEEEPVFAFARSFKLNATSNPQGRNSESVTFTMAHTQDPVIQFASAQGLKSMRPLWASYFTTDEELISFHYFDFAVALKLTSDYSKQIEKDIPVTGLDGYKDILALSARQVMGACSFAGTPDDPMIFLKEISSNGNMNTVDVIYPAFPFFLYTNPNWLAWLIEPLIDYMLSSQYPNNYSIHDLGSRFPNATGHPDGRDEYMPVEECGNMLIMGLALLNSLKYENQSSSFFSTDEQVKYLKSTHEKFQLHTDATGIDYNFGGLHAKRKEQAQRWTKRSYKLFKKWANYLVQKALIPENQLCTDDFAGQLANQTNLALKGIIGIRAMAEISKLVDEREDAKYFLEISQKYATLWQDDYALSRDGTHAKLTYTWFGSWTTLYNLFADSLLCFHLPPDSVTENPHEEFQSSLLMKNLRVSRTAFIDERVYRIQSDWYDHVCQRYGLPLDSRHLYAKSDWEFFAASVSSQHVRRKIVRSIALWVNETTTDLPLTDLYETEGTGGYPEITFKARPVVGGHFAILALERACDGKAAQALSFLSQNTHHVSQMFGKAEL